MRAEACPILDSAMAKANAKAANEPKPFLMPKLLAAGMRAEKGKSRNKPFDRGDMGRLRR